MVQGPLQFLAGFGAREQQVRQQEAEWQGQANRVTGTGIGTGIGNIFDTVATDMAAQRTSGRQLQNAQALQQGAQAGEMAQIQARYGAPADYGSVMAKLYGAGGGPMAGAAPEAAPGEYGVSLPDQGMSQTFPEQQQGPLALAPGNVKDFRDAEAELISLNASRKLFIQGSHTPAEEMGFAHSFMPKYNAAKTRYNELRQSQPKPPTTFPEMAAAGVHNGGITVAPDGSWLVPKGMTRAMPPKTAPINTMPWLDEPDPIKAEQMKQADWNARSKIALDAEGQPTLFLKQDNGEWAPAKTEGKATTTKPIDYRKEAAGKIKPTTEGVLPPTAVATAVEERQKEKEAAFAFEIDDYNAETITLDEYRELGAKILMAYGHEGNVPRALRKSLTELGRKYQPVPAWYTGQKRP
jgi:hypothetical protein